MVNPNVSQCFMLPKPYPLTVFTACQARLSRKHVELTDGDLPSVEALEEAVALNRGTVPQVNDGSGWGWAKWVHFYSPINRRLDGYDGYSDIIAKIEMVIYPLEI